jgi:hypothetical protein
VTFGLGNVVEALFGAFRGLIWAGDNASGWGGFVGELFSRVIAGVGVLTVECATLCDRTANALPFEVGGWRPERVRAGGGSGVRPKGGKTWVKDKLGKDRLAKKKNKIGKPPTRDSQ